MEKKKIFVGTTSLLLVTLLLLGLTYAYYKTKIVGNSNEKSVSVVSKNLSVTYQNESAEISAEGIEPGYSATKTFEVKNTGNKTINYSIILDNVVNTFSRIQDWTYTLSSEDTIIKTGTLPNIEGAIVGNDSIEGNTTKSYSFTFKYANLEDVNQSEDMGKSLSFRINIGDENGNTFEGITLPMSTILNNEVKLSIPNTSYTDDDAGVYLLPEGNEYVYYYYGKVENNYLKYKDLMWRIVRTNNDGSLRIVLDEPIHINIEKANPVLGTYYSETAVTGLNGTGEYIDVTEKGITCFRPNSSATTLKESCYVGDDIVKRSSYDYFISSTASPLNIQSKDFLSITNVTELFADYRYYGAYLKEWLSTNNLNDADEIVSNFEYCYGVNDTITDFSCPSDKVFTTENGVGFLNSREISASGLTNSYLNESDVSFLFK